MKRLVDIVLASTGLVLLSPLMLVVALAVKLGDRGPVLFRQERVGRHFKPFRIFKFRTMEADAERHGAGVTCLGDPRITRVGRFLRDTKLDELPQLFNVLRGEMSLVGPRPELSRYVRLYPDEFRDVLKVRPGITDLASIAYRHESLLIDGHDDVETQYVRTILPDKLRLARIYVARASLAYDLGLILETLLLLAYPAKALDRILGRLGRYHEMLAVVSQAALAALANLGALLLRFDGAPPAEARALVLRALPALVLIRTFWLRRFQLDRDMWQYVGLRGLGSIVAAVALGTATFWALLSWPAAFAAYPRSVVILDGMLCVAALAGARVARRVDRMLRNRLVNTRSVLLVGGGDPAERALRDLLSHPRYDYQVVGLVTDDPSARGLRIHNVPIVGTFEELDEILRSKAPDEIVVLASAVPTALRSETIRRCRAFGKPFRVVPDLDDLPARNGAILSIGQPPAEDLLFREPVRVDLERVQAQFRGRRVMVTGAGGSIGSEICRQLAKIEPARIVLFEKHEASLFHIERELRAANAQLDIVPVIGDITDSDRVAQVLEVTRPQVVFHAAAYKHVPMMEHHPSEAYKTNVIGTRVVAEAAERAGVEIFVLISTDKAVEPVSTMGLTKRIAELTVIGMNGAGKPRYMVVRFGNVLDSSGSVVPLFREQIAKGGPITVTHAEVTRLFMTVPEAVQLILHAGTLGSGGEVFVLDMGKPVRILDLAKTLARLHGLRPGRDIDIVFTGLRPGERLFETLFNDHEKIWKTQHPKILMAANGSGGPEGREELHKLLAALEERIRSVPLARNGRSSTPPAAPQP